ncbi:olfactory receptor 11L1-like [Lissotriton helveticus]
MGLTQPTDCLENLSIVTEFQLLGFQVLPELQTLIFLIFLILYTLTVSGNVMIVLIVYTNNRLHSPMYFFLGNLSFLEIWYTTNFVPTLLGSLLVEGSTLSFRTCITQCCIFGWLVSTECFLLTIMAYDRYVAICNPFHYHTVMSQWLCIQLVVSAWMAGLINTSVTGFLLGGLKFIGKYKVEHFFCDLTSLLQATCSDTTLVEMEIFIMSIIVLSIPLTLIIVSYAYIIVAILRIPSLTGRQKAFSTCSSHLAVVITYFLTLTVIYMVPTRGHSFNLNKALSLLYTVVTPMANPIIYTFRNKEMKEALRKAIPFKMCLSKK